MAGAAGAKLACRCFEPDWIERMRDSRGLIEPNGGRRRPREAFGIEAATLAGPESLAAREFTPLPYPSR